jgi:sulfide:quinone oxidoreductase
VAANDDLVFAPSLVWVPFGLRDKAAITRLVRPILRAAGIGLRQAPVTRLELERREVVTPIGAIPFDALVVATGSGSDFAAIEGLGPFGGASQSITRWSEATLARLAFERFLDDPGPVVIGGAPGAACLDLAYEFLFAMVRQVRRHGLEGRAPIAFVTPEPYLGHVGRGDPGLREALAARLARDGVEAIVDARVRRVAADAIELADGRRLPSAYAMLVPRRVGSASIRACAAIADEDGLVAVDEWGRTPSHPNVYAVGAAAAVAQPGQVGPPSGGDLAEASAEVIAANVVADLLGQPAIRLPTLAQGFEPDELARLAALDPSAPPAPHRWVLPGPDARWARRSFDRLFADPAGVTDPVVSRR